MQVDHPHALVLQRVCSIQHRDCGYVALSEMAVGTDRPILEIAH